MTPSCAAFAATASTVDELAEEVGASRRTVLRDIGALRDEGYVIHSEVGRGGGLSLTLNQCRHGPSCPCPKCSRC